jgi:hypothetical protein
MKARIKATGEIIDVSRLVDKYIMTNHPHSITFDADELDFEFEPDYWEKLKHQYAGMFLQGMIIGKPFTRDYVEDAYKYATALVNKLKEEGK